MASTQEHHADANEASQQASSVADLVAIMSRLSIRDHTRGPNFKLKPKKANIFEWYESGDGYSGGSTLYTSYMPTIAAAGIGVRLATAAEFATPKSHPGLNSILDSGARSFLVSRTAFEDPDQVANAYAILNERGEQVMFQMAFDNDPSHQSIRGYLAQGNLGLGAFGRSVNVHNQRFYVCDDHPLLSGTFRALIGLAPEPLAGQATPTDEECPTVLRTIASRENLQLVLGVFISPWIEDAANQFTLRGQVDFGAVDRSICPDERGINWTRRVDTIPSYMGLSTTAAYGNLRSAMELMIYHGDRNEYELLHTSYAILDTGCPGIAMNDRTFRAWCNTLNYKHVPYTEVDVHGTTVLQIPKEYAPSLEGLVFTFHDREGKAFKIRIPSQHMVFPSRILQNMNLTPIENHLVLITFKQISHHDITLGIPFCEYIYFRNEAWFSDCF